MASGAQRPGGEHIIHWNIPEDVSSRETVQNYFTSPLTLPDEPQAYNSLQAYQEASHATAILKQDSLPEEKLSILQSMGKGINHLTEFAGKHPWLTAGMVLALLSIAATSYLTVNAFLGHTTFALFHAHPEIGAGLVFMSLYYSVYLVNLCRRAVIKDDLIKRFEAHNLLNQTKKDWNDIDIKWVVKEINKEIADTNVKLVSAEMQLRYEHNQLKMKFEQTNAILERLQSYETQLKDLLTRDLSEADKKNIQDALDKASNALKAGAEKLAFPDFPSEFPSIPRMEIGSTLIEIPDVITDTERENQLKARSLGQKFKDLFSNIGQFIQKNPGSTLLILSGLAICAFGGVGAYFWLHGMTNLYFFGALNAMTIPPVLIYGLCFIYEGYNSGTLNDLKRKNKQLDLENAQQKTALEQEAVRLKKIAKEARGTFQDFARSWREFHELESQKHQFALQRLSKDEVSLWREAAGFCEGILKPFLKNYPEIDPVEAKRILMEPAQGAAIAASAHHSTPSVPQRIFTRYV